MCFTERWRRKLVGEKLRVCIITVLLTIIQTLLKELEPEDEELSSNVRRLFSVIIRKNKFRNRKSEMQL